MSAKWEAALARWAGAGLIDAPQAERIRQWEQAQQLGEGTNKLAAIAFGFGALLLIAGLLLFVSAHWDAMSPDARFGLVLGMVAVFHLAGALCGSRSPRLATALHAAGTGTLGGGIYLAGQIFNMAEHWPGAIMLWALGAALALALLRDWPHVLWLAVLLPTWLWGEWLEGLARSSSRWQNAAPIVGTVLLAFAYLAAQARDEDPIWRRALSRLGAIALIPACVLLGVVDSGWWLRPSDIENGGATLLALSWLATLALPFALAFYLRGRSALLLVIPALWSLVVIQFHWGPNADDAALHALYALAAIGIAIWGVRAQRPMLINLAVFGFALTVLGFYFSNFLDKLDRSVSLLFGGVLFLLGGWLLEKLRRRLIAGMKGVPA